MRKWIEASLGTDSFLGRFLARVTGRFTTWPADEFSRFTRSAQGTPTSADAATQPPAMEPIRAPAPRSITPENFELRFARLLQQGRYEDMWELIAEDARRAWGGRGEFLRRMREQRVRGRVVDAQIKSVRMLPRWTDGAGHRTYRHVATLSVHYLVRDGNREVSIDRQVHLIPAAGGWRTLFYPVED